jgi:hypothetical protein
MPLMSLRLEVLGHFQVQFKFNTRSCNSFAIWESNETAKRYQKISMYSELDSRTEELERKQATTPHEIVFRVRGQGDAYASYNFSDVIVYGLLGNHFNFTTRNFFDYFTHRFIHSRFRYITCMFRSSYVLILSHHDD